MPPNDQPAESVSSLQFQLGTLTESARATNERLDRFHTDFTSLVQAIEKRFATKDEVNGLGGRLEGTDTRVSNLEAKVWKIGVIVASGAAGAATAAQTLLGG